MDHMVYYEIDANSEVPQVLITSYIYIIICWQQEEALFQASSGSLPGFVREFNQCYLLQRGINIILNCNLK